MPDKDADLTHIRGRSQKAQGEVVFVSGRILDVYGNPIEGAFINVWQANTWGKYWHEDDMTPNPIDPNFQGWAQLGTRADGKYSLMTIKPGPYPLGGNLRTPHIHFMVERRGYRTIPTQMYFKDHPLNDEDEILEDVTSPTLRNMLIVDFKAGFGTFDIVLARG